MVMGELHSRVDLAVIGGGVGGYVAAIRAAQLGLNVALVEKDKLGSKVTIIARTDVLSKFDPDAVRILKGTMTKLGMDVLAGVSPQSHDATSVKLSDGKVIDAEIIIVAIGLKPFTQNLGLENTKVKLDSKGFIGVVHRTTIRLSSHRKSE